MATWHRPWTRLAIAWVTAALAGIAQAQPAAAEPAHVELPPARSGPLLVLLTGADGAPNHLGLATDFARLGWVVHVVDSNALMADPVPSLRALLAGSLPDPR